MILKYCGFGFILSTRVKSFKFKSNLTHEGWNIKKCYVIEVAKSLITLKPPQSRDSYVGKEK